MNRFAGLIMLLASLSTVGCSTMNSDFSCKATAKDRCLSIEDVDAMTRFADEEEKTGSQIGVQKKQVGTVIAPYLSQKTVKQAIWLAPTERATPAYNKNLRVIHHAHL